MNADSTNVTLRKAREMFINDLKKKGRVSATILAYGKDVEQLIDYAGSLHKYTPQAITTQDIENFKVHLKNQKYTAKSISRKVNSIKSLFIYTNNSVFWSTSIFAVTASYI